MLSTIQPIGINPVNPPRIAALAAISVGMPKPMIAMAIAAARPAPAATWALRCIKPSPINMTATGTAAASVDMAMLLNGS